MNKVKKYFFGWSNIKWIVRELTKIYSNDKSFFSKKRIESAIAFVILQWGMIYSLLNISSKGLEINEVILWSGVELLICGYTVNQIQNEKLKKK